jgi:hypothetical protein
MRFDESRSTKTMMARYAILIVVAVLAGLVAIRLRVQQHDLWSIVGGMMIFLLSVAWFFVRWYVPRQA